MKLTSIARNAVKEMELSLTIMTNIAAMLIWRGVGFFLLYGLAC